MSCSYPSCMMGGGCCPYEDECNGRDREAERRLEEKRQLDLDEQRLRIKILKQQAGESTSTDTSPCQHGKVPPCCNFRPEGQ